MTHSTAVSRTLKGVVPMFKTTRAGIRATRVAGMSGATAERIRFHRDGRVSAYGAMPNANHVIGWWLVGYAAEIHQAVRDADARAA